MQVAILADTHAPRFWKRCPLTVARRLEGMDLILHAGDVCTPEVLDELTAYAPVRVVLGNNDGPEVAAWGAQPELSFDLGGLRLAMIHDSGPAGGRPARLRSRFPDADLVVFGHSHIPWRTSSVAGARTQILFNPGSPTDKRRQSRGTMGVLREIDGVVEDLSVIEV